MYEILQKLQLVLIVHPIAGHGSPARKGFRPVFPNMGPFARFRKAKVGAQWWGDTGLDLMARVVWPYAGWRFDTILRCEPFLFTFPRQNFIT